MRRLLVDVADVDSLRDSVLEGRTGELRGVPEAFTLGALLELACCWSTWRGTGESAGRGVVERWATESTALQCALSAIAGRVLAVADVFGAPLAELFALRGASDVTSSEYKLFLKRFGKSLAQNGFSERDAKALPGALGEMADNIAQHSSPTRRAPAPGILAYHVDQRWMSFAVVDVGQGVLASLRANPMWASISTEQAALMSAVMHRATSRVRQRLGNGFFDLHRALADLSGRLRFRSGDAALVLDGRDIHGRRVTMKQASFLPGFQLVVSCSLDPNPYARAVPHVFT